MDFDRQYFRHTMLLAEDRPGVMLALLLDKLRDVPESHAAIRSAQSAMETWPADPNSQK